ncbi:hypothetical protein RvY_16073 [Ramazzottius varieornatus]|uniref:Uncharacterized protein n=1 Tax=Ramazzottius varieornatus TaxID=947166 RepID=A0A1D1W3R3_RAMVA|nr:hypothetical protein RvY_16073 [Ramazzottius varieornatus]
MPMPYFRHVLNPVPYPAQSRMFVEVVTRPMRRKGPNRRTVLPFRSTVLPFRSTVLPGGRNLLIQPPDHELNCWTTVGIV